jgi:hypothetical protein
MAKGSRDVALQPVADVIPFALPRILMRAVISRSWLQAQGPRTVFSRLWYRRRQERIASSSAGRFHLCARKATRLPTARAVARGSLTDLPSG